MVNKVILLGNLGKDPLIRRTESGVPVATFSLATSETWKDGNGQKQEKTEWHNIVMWRGLAEVSEKYLKKGSQIYVEGKLTTRSYEHEGVTRWITEVVAHSMVMTGKPNGHTAPMPPEPPGLGAKTAQPTTGISNMTPEFENLIEPQTTPAASQVEGGGEGVAAAISPQVAADQGAGNGDDELPF